MGLQTTETALVTFGMGARGWEWAARRLQRQAKRSGWFDTIEVWTSQRFEAEHRSFWVEHSQFMTTNRRGFGYWIWRPKIIQYHLRRARPNQVFVFLDAGCELNINPSSAERLGAYLDHVQKFGMLVMDLEDETLAKWCKQDLLQTVNQAKLATQKSVVEAGVLIARSTEETLNIVDEWVDLSCKDNYHLIDDTRSVAAEHPSFVEHRHDQSILSCLVLPGMRFQHETFFPNAWSTDGANYPVWACRNSRPFLKEQNTRIAAGFRKLRELRRSKLMGFC